MKKTILNLSVFVATIAASSSAHAWLCTARATDGSLAWGQWVSPYLNYAQQGAWNQCAMRAFYPNSCLIVSCY